MYTDVNGRNDNGRIRRLGLCLDICSNAQSSKKNLLGDWPTFSDSLFTYEDNGLDDLRDKDFVPRLSGLGFISQTP